ncbi:hypothetical protein [Povalibacter sp.]|uniref:hypothetical protein n=1 Tax=Povalibacter sp. TaxID=1962978 RepID=UPI002F3ED1D0
MATPIQTRNFIAVHPYPYDRQGNAPTAHRFRKPRGSPLPAHYEIVRRCPEPACFLRNQIGIFLGKEQLRPLDAPNAFASVGCTRFMALVLSPRRRGTHPVIAAATVQPNVLPMNCLRAPVISAGFVAP